MFCFAAVDAFFGQRNTIRQGFYFARDQLCGSRVQEHRIAISAVLAVQLSAQGARVFLWCAANNSAEVVGREPRVIGCDFELCDLAIIDGGHP